MNTQKKKYEDLRSNRWFGDDSIRTFGHRSRAMQMGYDEEDWKGKRSLVSSIPGLTSILAILTSNSE